MRKGGSHTVSQRPTSERRRREATAGEGVGGPPPRKFDLQMRLDVISQHLGSIFFISICSFFQSRLLRSKNRFSSKKGGVRRVRPHLDPRLCPGFLKRMGNGGGGKWDPHIKTSKLIKCGMYGNKILETGKGGDPGRVLPRGKGGG